MKRRTALSFAVVIGLGLAFVPSSSAERQDKELAATTHVVTFATDVRVRPAETASGVVHVEVGDTLEVIGRKGRWVRVRVHGKRGWLPRTTIRQKVGEGSGWASNEIRVDGKKRRVRSDSAVTAYATRRTKAREKRSKRSGKVFGVRANDRLQVLDDGGKWVRVRNRKGQRGWVRRAALDLDAAEVPADVSRATASDLTDEDDQPVWEGGELEVSGRNRPRELLSAGGLETNLAVSLGGSNYSRRFTSNGDGALGGYKISAASMVASARGAASFHLGRFSLAARGSYRTNVGAPGIRVQSADGEPSDPNTFYIHEVSGRLELGVTLGSEHPVRVAVTGGYQYGYFIIAEIQNNPALLSREKLSGVVGGIAASTGVTDEILLSVDVEVMPLGRFKQTENLEDGMQNSVYAVGGSAHAAYLLDSGYAIDVGYGVRRTKLEFTGQSPRQFDVTQAFRKDTDHTFTLGATRTF